MEFFLDLLQDLTKMMDGDAALDSEPDRVDELNEIENKALRELLLMEFELENTMRRVRKRMMIVRLISLLSGRKLSNTSNSFFYQIDKMSIFLPFFQRMKSSKKQ